jgi:hypothetical protein
MRVEFVDTASLWKPEAPVVHQITVMRRSVAKAGIIEIARAMARKAARDDHVLSISEKG